MFEKRILFQNRLYDDPPRPFFLCQVSECPPPVSWWLVASHSAGLRAAVCFSMTPSCTGPFTRVRPSVFTPFSFVPLRRVDLSVFGTRRWRRRRPQSGLHGGPLAPQRGCGRETGLGLHFHPGPPGGQGGEIGVSETDGVSGSVCGTSSRTSSRAHCVHNVRLIQRRSSLFGAHDQTSGLSYQLHPCVKTYIRFVVRCELCTCGDVRLLSNVMEPDGLQLWSSKRHKLNISVSL